MGYLPEERGLYRNLKVLDVLVYLGQLKGVPRALAQKHARAWLERVELEEWGRRKVNDLSRGMQQKVQFVACLIHDPQLLILDEPFQGLDPVNVDLLQILIRDLQAQGKTIVLSAHEMSMVEALCDRICLINHGKAVLYGRLDEIKRQFASRTVRVRTPALPASLPGVVRVDQSDDFYTLTLGDISAQEVLRALVECGTTVESFEVASAPLQEIFVSVVIGPGEQDITAHVNFDMLIDKATALGWKSDPLKTQREFLMEWGLHQRLIEEEQQGLFNVARMNDRLGLKTLLLPRGISDTMKVLVQSVKRERVLSAMLTQETLKTQEKRKRMPQQGFPLRFSCVFSVSCVRHLRLAAFLLPFAPTLSPEAPFVVQSACPRGRGDPKMVAAAVIWILVLAVFAYVYWKPGFKTATQLVTFARAQRSGLKASLDLRTEVRNTPWVRATFPTCPRLSG